MGKRIKDKRLVALLEGLEVENIDELIEKEPPKTYRILGEKIAAAAKHGRSEFFNRNGINLQ